MLFYLISRREIWTTPVWSAIFFPLRTRCEIARAFFFFFYRPEYGEYLQSGLLSGGCNWVSVKRERSRECTNCRNRVSCSVARAGTIRAKETDGFLASPEFLEAVVSSIERKGSLVSTDKCRRPWKGSGFITVFSLRKSTGRFTIFWALSPLNLSAP